MDKAGSYDINSPEWSEGRFHIVGHYKVLLSTYMAEILCSWVGSSLFFQEWLCSGMPGPGQSEFGNQYAEWWLGLLLVE